ncbi:c-type cytochrome [Bradyrhizobium sp. STM 3562]|uniref:c-type cytochrome n=1 Tax=Bradyrhizobium sp. STM 3562 TaxID=578924 RepID=UPI00388F07D3
MRIRLWLIPAVAIGAAGVLAAWLITAPRPAASSIPAAAFEKTGDPARGRLIFAAGDCASCHASPGQPDRLRLGGGIALASPFGTFRPPNISMDPVDGIGAWQAKDLANALLSGVSPDGRHYYPLFPYPSFAHMTVGDVIDLMAYLRTLPAVQGRAPPHEISPLFRIRRMIGFWKLIFFDRTQIKPDVRRDPEWNRGRYLVESIGHCAECHSARNVFGAIEESTRMAGGLDPTGTGFVPNITPQHIGNWSKQDIAEMLKTGITPLHMRVGSSMSEVVTDTAMLPDSDRQAIATYLKSLPSRPTPEP